MSWQEILAAASTTDEKNDVRYLSVPARRVLNPVRAPDVPFDYGLNPYLNCELDCAYCFARDFADRRQGPGAAPTTAPGAPTAFGSTRFSMK